MVRRSSPTNLPGRKRPTADAGTSHGFTASVHAFILIDRFCRPIVVRASRHGWFDVKYKSVSERCPRGRAEAFAKVRWTFAPNARARQDAEREARHGWFDVKYKSVSERCSRGRRGYPAKGVSGQKPDRGFDKIAGSDFGRPNGRPPERSVGRASWMIRAYPERNTGSPRPPLLHLLDAKQIRRGAREAEGAPLLREYRVKSLIEGSNPSLSATNAGRFR